jgi:hypothetical protein
MGGSGGSPVARLSKQQPEGVWATLRFARTGRLSRQSAGCNWDWGERARLDDLTDDQRFANLSRKILNGWTAHSGAFFLLRAALE